MLDFDHLCAQIKYLFYLIMVSRRSTIHESEGRTRTQGRQRRHKHCECLYVEVSLTCRERVPYSDVQRQDNTRPRTLYKYETLHYGKLAVVTTFTGIITQTSARDSSEFYCVFNR